MIRPVPPGPVLPPPVLIVGSYPPIPVAGAPITVREVRRAWAAGDEVTVVSPRLSAAHLAVPVHGVLAGRRLANVRRVAGANRLVLVVEEGFPFSGPAPVQLATAALLLRSLRGFRHVRVVRAGPVPLADGIWDRLVAAADEVAADEPGPTAPGVTPIGPPEVERAERPAQVADAAARRLLGSRYPAGRARLGAVRRRLGRR